MNLTTYDDLIEAISDLQVRGYTRTFDLKNNMFFCIQTGRFYAKNEITIIEHHRYKDQGIEEGNQIVFAIKCIDGEQGYIISPKAINKKIDFLKFMDKVKVQLTD